ncbi:MAG: histidine kinase [Clostridia bacterium]|nr:histidine kinase [Clostridia bacterium]
MWQQITDKVIVFLLSLLIITQVTLGSGWVVAIILAMLLIIFLTQLFNRNIEVLIVSAVLLVASIIVPQLMILFASGAYPLITSKSIKDAIYNKKISRELNLYLIPVLVLIGGYIAISVINGVFLNVVIILLAIVLGIKTSYHEATIVKLTTRYDDARYEAVEAFRKRRIAREHEEEKIYMATLEERNRIAREIHDNIGHMLTRVIVQMQALKIINKDENLAPQLDSVSDTLNEAMTAVRRSVHELHNESIDLSISINDIVKTVPDRFKVKVNTMLESAVPNDVKAAMIAIVKESVTNIVKYSKGDRVRVDIIENNTFWKLSIEDNGKNPKHEYSGGAIGEGEGIGLSNIFTRCNALGGRANISSDENGFKIVCNIPINK